MNSSDKFHIEAATGWLGLGNWKEANEELEKVSAEMRAHPDVLNLRCQVYMAAQKWDAVVDLARTLTQLDPKEPARWLVWALATRRSQKDGAGKAKEILERAQPIFPRDAVIAYDLACYCCLSGDFKQAKYWLELSFGLGNPKEMRLKALDDPDLEALWKQIGKL